MFPSARKKTGWPLILHPISFDEIGYFSNYLKKKKTPQGNTGGGTGFLTCFSEAF